MEVIVSNQTILSPVATAAGMATSGADHGSSSSFIVELNSNDVLFGRGAPSIGNEGNVRFRRLVQARKLEYINTGKRQIKDMIARQIIETIAERDGRFVRKIESLVEAEEMGVPSGVGAWVLVDDATVLQKVKQALRDRDAGESLGDSDGTGTGGGDEEVPDALGNSPVRFAAPPSTMNSMNQLLISQQHEKTRLQLENHNLHRFMQQQVQHGRLSQQPPSLESAMLYAMAPPGSSQHLLQRMQNSGQQNANILEQLRNEQRQIESQRIQRALNTIQTSAEDRGAASSMLLAQQPSSLGGSAAILQQFQLQQQLQQQQLQQHQQLPAASSTSPMARSGVHSPQPPHPFMGTMVGLDSTNRSPLAAATSGSSGFLHAGQQDKIPVTSMSTGPPVPSPSGNLSAGELSIEVSMVEYELHQSSSAGAERAGFPTYSFVETCIFLTLCSWGLPVWMDKSQEPDSADQKDYGLSWMDFGRNLESAAQELWARRRSPGGAEGVQVPGHQLTPIRALARNPRELALVTISLLEHLGLDRRVRASGTGPRVDEDILNWLDGELSRWAKEMNVHDDTGRPIPYSAAMYQQHQSAVPSTSAVMRPAALHAGNTSLSIYGQVAQLTCLRALFISVGATKIQDILTEHQPNTALAMGSSATKPSLSIPAKMMVLKDLLKRGVLKGRDDAKDDGEDSMTARQLSKTLLFNAVETTIAQVHRNLRSSRVEVVLSQYQQMYQTLSCSDLNIESQDDVDTSKRQQDSPISAVAPTKKARIDN
jgi:hypothetical protein